MAYVGGQTTSIEFAARGVAALAATVGAAGSELRGVLTAAAGAAGSDLAADALERATVWAAQLLRLADDLDGLALLARTGALDLSRTDR